MRRRKSYYTKVVEATCGRARSARFARDLRSAAKEVEAYRHKTTPSKPRNPACPRCSWTGGALLVVAVGIAIYFGM